MACSTFITKDNPPMSGFVKIILIDAHYLTQPSFPEICSSSKW